MGISDFIAYIPIFLPACKWKRLSVWMYEERYKFIFRRTVTREEIKSFIEKEYQEQKDNVQKAWLKITLDKYYNPGKNIPSEKINVNRVAGDVNRHFLTVLLWVKWHSFLWHYYALVPHMSPVK